MRSTHYIYFPGNFSRYLMNDNEFYVIVEGGLRFRYRLGLRGCWVLPGTFGLSAVNATHLHVSSWGRGGSLCVGDRLIGILFSKDELHILIWYALHNILTSSTLDFKRFEVQRHEGITNSGSCLVTTFSGWFEFLLLDPGQAGTATYLVICKKSWYTIICLLRSFAYKAWHYIS